MNYQALNIFLSGRNAESRLPTEFSDVSNQSAVYLHHSMRMVVRVHRGPADIGRTTHSSLRPAAPMMIFIWSGLLLTIVQRHSFNQANFAGRHFNCAKFLHPMTKTEFRRYGILAPWPEPFPRCKRDAGRNKLYRHSIAGFISFFFLRADNDIANFQTDRSDDISFSPSTYLTKLSARRVPDRIRLRPTFCGGAGQQIPPKKFMAKIK